MYYVYLLKSDSFNRKYIGCTSDLQKRLHDHNRKLVRSTSKYSPWKLIYYEAYISKYDAFNREKLLKTDFTFKRHLLIRLKESLK